MASYEKMSAETSLAKAQLVIRRIIASRDDHFSLVTQIAIEVGGEIIEEVLPPGHDLNSVDLAKRYRTSRTPIREALMLLEKEGLVDVPPRRRPRVMVLDTATLGEIYRTRATLLELVAADVASHASNADIAALADQVQRMEEASRANDLRAYLWRIIEFHDLNLSASGNQTAKRIVESLLLRTIQMRRWSLSTPGRMATSLDDHRRLVQAYENRDANLAAALVRSNHMFALKNIERLHAQGDLSTQSEVVE